MWPEEQVEVTHVGKFFDCFQLLRHVALKLRDYRLKCGLISKRRQSLVTGIPSPGLALTRVSGGLQCIQRRFFVRFQREEFDVCNGGDKAVHDRILRVLIPGKAGIN